jgi:hypothetical protein
LGSRGGAGAVHDMAHAGKVHDMAHSHAAIELGHARQLEMARRMAAQLKSSRAHMIATAQREENEAVE